MTFLNEPLFFTQFGIANVIASSVAPNSTFVSVSFHAAAGGPDSERGGVFWYVWNNDSDSAMLTTVSTALELTGWMQAIAPSPWLPGMPEEATRSRLAGELFVSFNDGSSLESREFLFADVRAEARFFTDSEGQTFETRSMACPSMVFSCRPTARSSSGLGSISGVISGSGTMAMPPAVAILTASLAPA